MVTLLAETNWFPERLRRTASEVLLASVPAPPVRVTAPTKMDWELPSMIALALATGAASVPLAVRVTFPPESCCEPPASILANEPGPAPAEIESELKLRFWFPAAEIRATAVLPAAVPPPVSERVPI